MSNISLAAEYTSLVLNGEPITDFADGDTIKLTYVNEHTSRSRGKTGVSVQNRSDRNVADLLLRVQKFSDNDIYLNSQINASVPVIFSGSIKENYISDDEIASVSSYALEGGSFTIKPEGGENNQDGVPVNEYTIQFNSAIRTL